jgi:hypothetical protein
VLGPAALLTGCGEEHHPIGRRPAQPIMVTARIGGKRVEVSPASFGAGPVEVLVSNQSGRAQHLTFATDETGGGPAGIRSSTAVPLGGTAQIQVSPRRGRYLLSVRDRGVRPASIHVGKPRRSSPDAGTRP